MDRDLVAAIRRAARPWLGPEALRAFLAELRAELGAEERGEIEVSELDRERARKEARRLGLRVCDEADPER